MAGFGSVTTPEARRPPSELAHRSGLIRRDGPRWLVAIDNRRARVADLVGMGYLAELLTHPGQEIPALALTSGGSAPRDPVHHELLDDTARTAYAGRVRELRADLDEAEANNDIARRELLQGELDALVDQLEVATGFGGRPRAFTDSTERARTAVSKAIKRAIDAIDDASPVIAEVLRKTVSTGATCLYRPEPRRPVVWTTGHSPGGDQPLVDGPSVGDERVSSTTIGDRLHVEGGRHFVGRMTELDLARTALHASNPPFSMLYVHGPGGVGKTALLDTLASSAASTGKQAVRLDLHTTEPIPSAFLDAFALAAGLGDGEVTPQALARCGHLVALIDTFELGEPLQAWLRHDFFASLPSSSLVVIAGRNPPPPEWLADPAWRALSRVVVLDNLPEEEASRYLELQGVESRLHPQLWALTRGHPLALSLVADLFFQRTEQEHDITDLIETPDVVRTLMHRFVGEIPDPRHREALAVCAHTRFTTEDLLRSAMGVDDASELFDWLRSRPFVEEGRFGVFPHDLARDVLDTDLRWRDRIAYEDFHRRVRAHIMDRIRRARGRAQQRAATDLLFLHRLSPVMRPLHDWATLGHVHVDRLEAGDADELVAMTRAHQGSAQAAHVAHWLAEQPEAFLVFRRAEREVAGFATLLRLDRARAGAIADDPGAAAMHGYVMASDDPPKAGDAVTAARFLVDREQDQRPPSPTLTAMSVAHIIHALGTPGLTIDLVGTVRSPDMSTVFEHLEYRRVPDAEFDVDGHHHVVFAHDFRLEGPEAWLDRMGDREIDEDTRCSVPALATEPLLSKAEFAAAVRAALRNLHRPDELAANPLVRFRQLERVGGGHVDASRLAELVATAVETLAVDPRDAKARQAIERTYLHPAETQERAAEVLELPFSTYRRHLSRGIDRIVQELWARRDRQQGEQEVSRR
jgi:hypothetical protein